MSLDQQIFTLRSAIVAAKRSLPEQLDQEDKAPTEPQQTVLPGNKIQKLR